MNTIAAMNAAGQSVSSALQGLPGARRLSGWLRQVCLAAASPGLLLRALAARLDARPLLLFYCNAPGHRQTIHEFLVALRDQSGDDHFNIVLLNSFDHRQRAPELALPCLIEHGNVPAAALRWFRPALVVTPMVGFKRNQAAPGAIIVHLLVSLTSLDGVYHETHFDDYDYIVCAGEHQVQAFRDWRAARPQLAGKVLVRGGYPKLDLLLREPAPPRAPAAAATVIYAPTHVYPVNEMLASLRTHGPAIVRALLAEGWHVIFRPHPVSFTDEDAELVRRIAAEHAACPRFVLDRSPNYQRTYSSAQLMVTDVSGTGFTYAFSFGRPAVYFAPNAAAEAGLSGLQFDGREQIGGVARDISQLIALSRRLLADAEGAAARIAACRDKSIYHLGESGRYLAERLPVMLQREKCEDWERL